MTREEKLIKSKLGLLELGEYLQNVSEACRVMGYSRDTFYRVKDAYESGGIEALKEEGCRKPNRKNRVSEEVEAAVIAIAVDQPTWGQVRVSNELRKTGVFISACGVRCVWLRHDLETTKRRRTAKSKRCIQDILVPKTPTMWGSLRALERSISRPM